MSKSSKQTQSPAGKPAKKAAAQRPATIGAPLPVEAPPPPFVEGSLSGEAGGGLLEAPAPAAPIGPIAKRGVAVDEPAPLPSGALIGMRQSGGLRFKSIEVVVYEDGRVGWSRIGTGEDRSSGERTLTRPKLAELRVLVEAAGAVKPSRRRAKQPPDALAYELLFPKRTIEAFGGAIPDALAPLIEVLQKLVPKR